MKVTNSQQQTKYKGLTKREYKRVYGSSTRGIDKCETCRATGLDKALAKYPRAYRAMEVLYTDFNKKKDKHSERKTLSGGTLTLS